ncbi:hypothetical protein PHYBLDRAFT_144311 [Phycomyces blakesleeanus NRRL 1555(-)]|uniref:Uncharacterized protein n=1 Tax=Phycomyces blakesleeanus (strain ATCC 8743b / DSM 1359 / FGSC 10004 / NBRC 33097 / NRRL 1555) TaxID=763407 RepID=A0A162NK23_PHYB8|nr:hypothetical protein PHYBLDRAFT_144311 [Phycomyces blakesleeanus NRRL 1555(-)]OAD74958.1 hypothetical protein PHYBLDRAFT_144311 [Phycomyces blakesleeanus NRRL 1555(-)]|eukprot:XP_018292998.1 hypothetical protein PHYBLDRAFT_144311 [Phycomyces blakesleeanus NRRL 1555(-)]
MSKRGHDESELVNSLRQKLKVDQSANRYYAKKTFELLMQAQRPNQRNSFNEPSYALFNTDIKDPGFSLKNKVSCHRCSTPGHANECTFCEKGFCADCSQRCELSTRPRKTEFSVCHV